MQRPIYLRRLDSQTTYLRSTYIFKTQFVSYEKIHIIYLDNFGIFMYGAYIIFYKRSIQSKNNHEHWTLLKLDTGKSDPLTDIITRQANKCLASRQGDCNINFDHIDVQHLSTQCIMITSYRFLSYVVRFKFRFFIWDDFLFESYALCWIETESFCQIWILMTSKHTHVVYNGNTAKSFLFRVFILILLTFF